MDEKLKNDLWTYFKHLGKDALIMSHYDLEEITEHSAETWKLFLNEPDVVSWVDSELAIIQDAELKKLVNNINTSNSVGKAQIINSLSKLSEKITNKEGPVFVYCYIPPNAEQSQAENVITLNQDPFLKEI